MNKKSNLNSGVPRSFAKGLGRSLTLLAGAAFCLGVVPSAFSADAAWTASSGNWQDDTNWDGTAPGSTSSTDSADIATFADSGDGTVTVDSDRNVAGLLFSSGGSAYTFDGGPLLLTGSGQISVAEGSGGDIAFDGPVGLLGAYTVRNDSDDRGVSFSGNISSDDATLTLRGDSDGQNEISGSLNLGEGGLTLQGPNTRWILTGDNSYTGRTTVGLSEPGFVELHITNNNSVAHSNEIRIQGGLGDRQNRLVLSNDVTLGMRIDTRESRIVDYAFPSGGHNFNPHIINLSGTNTIDGDITVSQAGGQGPVMLSESGTLVLNNLVNQRTDTRTFGFYGAGDIEVRGTLDQENNNGGVQVFKNGPGTVSFVDAAKAYTQPTQVFGGTLLINTVVGSDTATGNRLSVGTAGDMAEGSIATLGGDGTFKSAHVDGVIIGGGISDRSGNALTQTGARITAGDIGTVGTLTLDSNITFQGDAGAFATYHVDINGSGNDHLIVNGNLNLLSDYNEIHFEVDGTLDAESYTLITYSGNRSGTFSNVSGLPAGYVVEYADGEVRLVEGEGNGGTDPEPNGDLLTWAPPQLHNPVTIQLTNANAGDVHLSPGQDYIIEIMEKLTVSVNIHGGNARNIVMIGGEIEIGWQGDWPEEGPNFEPERTALDHARRGLRIRNWTGVFHIEGLWIHGDDLAEGIVVDTRAAGATMQIQNCRIGPLISRQEEKDVDWIGVNHPDIIQNYGGPTYYRVDRLTGYSDYQIFMIQPDQFTSTAITHLMDIRNSDFHQTPDSGGYLWFWARANQGNVLAFNIENVWLNPERGDRWAFWPEETSSSWNDIPTEIWEEFQKLNIGGYPPEGNFVPLGVAGLDYESPGYLEAPDSAFNEAVWTGGDGNWEDEANWNAFPIPGSTESINNPDKAAFALAEDGTVTVDEGRNLQYLDFLTGGSAYTFDGGKLRLTGDGFLTVHQGAGEDIVFNNDVEFLAGFSIINNSNDRNLTFNGEVIGVPGSTLIFGGDSDGVTRLNGSLDLSGAARINKSGTGELELNGASNFVGHVAVSGGSVHATNDTAAGTGANWENYIRVSGGGERLHHFALSGDVSIERNVDAAESRWFDPERSAPFIVSRSGDNEIIGSFRVSGLGGAGAVIRTESGSLRLDGDFSINMNNGRVWGFDGGGETIVAGDFLDRSSTQPARVAKNGTGILRFVDDWKEYTGTTQVWGGTLLIDTTVGYTSYTANRLTVGSTGSLSGSTATLGGTGRFRSGDGVYIGHTGLADGPHGTSGIITAGEAGSIGSFQLFSNVTFVGASEALATYRVDLDDVTSDRLVITGAVDLTSPYSAIEFVVDSETGTGAESYTLMTIDGTLNGQFANVIGLPDGYFLEYTSDAINLVFGEQPAEDSGFELRGTAADANDWGSDSLIASSLAPADVSAAEGISAVLGQSFQPEQSQTLEGLSIVGQSTGEGVYSLVIYELGSGAPLTSGSYDAGNVVHSMEFSTASANAEAMVYDFDLDLAETVYLVAGYNYVIELSRISGAEFNWYRMSDADSQYDAGALFENRQALNSGAYDAAFSLEGNPVAYTEAERVAWAAEVFGGHVALDVYVVSDIVGVIYAPAYPWVFLYQLEQHGEGYGWVYVVEDSTDEGLYFFQPARDAWWYATADSYPWIYLYGEDADEWTTF